MPDFRATTALATLEEKLRRALGLAGQIGASFDPRLTPVIIAGDLREPGNASFSGRHFAMGAYATYTAPYQSISFPVDVLLTSLRIWVQTAGQFNAYITGPGVAPASNPVPFQNIGTWSDRKGGSTDLTPFLISTLAGTALLGTDHSLTNRIASARPGGSGTIGAECIASPIMLTAGSHLNWHWPVLGDFAFAIQGRIWP